MTEQAQDLKRGAISLWHALAQGLGMNGPAGVVALYYVGLAGLVGGAMPLDVLLAWLIYLAMTIPLYEWSKIVAASYGWAAIQKRAWGSAVSLFASVTYWYYYMTGLAGFAILGFASFAYLLFPSIATAYPWLWIPIVIIITVEISLLTYYGIKPSTSYVLYTGLAEVAFLIITSFALVVLAGSNNTLMVFTPAPVNWNWVLIGVSMIFGITTFGGMNGIIPVAEETKDPKKNVPKALAYLSLILGFTLILGAYAQTVIYGPSNMFNYATLPDPGIIIYIKYFGIIGAGLLAIFVLNSYNSSAVSFANNAIRMAYGTGRDGLIFPKSLLKINKHGVPGNLVWFTAIITIVISIIAGELLGPLMGGIFLITSNAFFSYINHMLAAAGIARYHYGKSTFKWFRHLIIPVIVIVALAAAIILAVYPAPSYPLNYAAYVAGAYVIVFFIIYAIVRSKYRERLEKFGDFSL
jgi:Amino acid transporters